MTRWAIALLLAACSVLPVWAQRHGGAGFGGRSGGGFHGPAIGGRGPGFGGHGLGGRGFAGPGFGGGGFRFGRGPRSGPGFGGRFFPNRFGHGTFFFGAYPWVYSYGPSYIDPGYYDPGYYADYSYAGVPSSAQGYNPAAANFDSASQIQQQEIDRLETEVDRLREERENRSRPEPQADARPATVLMFQDKHREEVQNYAIVGQTLWIMTELKARKIPIANLDIAATTKANEDRGIDFHLPE